jgi:hypothetical protein
MPLFSIALLSPLARALAAILGGYALTASATALLAVTLPLPRADAAVTATLLSFALYTAAAVRVFAVRSAWRAWLEMLGPAAIMAFLVWSRA